MDQSSSLSNPTSCVSTSNVSKDKKLKKGAGGPKLSTDPQSVAARQRRHRISDRFKILQSLVPGGSKLDTVSMLEEAIQYVMFLKAQIWALHQATIGPGAGYSAFAPCEFQVVDRNVDLCNNYLVGDEFGRPDSWFSGGGNKEHF